MKFQIKVIARHFSVVLFIVLNRVVQRFESSVDETLNCTTEMKAHAEYYFACCGLFVCLYFKKKFWSFPLVLMWEV